MTAIRDNRLSVAVMTVFQIYLTGTLLGYLFGPFTTIRTHTAQVVLFCLTYQVALLFGFLFALRTRFDYSVRQVSEGDSDQPARRSKTLDRLLVFGLVVTCVLAYASLARASGSYSPLTVMGELIQALLSPGSAYRGELANSATAVSGWDTQLTTLLSPLTHFATAIGLFRFRRSGWGLRLLLVAALGLQILTGVVRGQNFPAFKVAVIILALLLIRLAGGISKRTAAVLITAIALTTALFLVYFLNATTSRVTAQLPDRILDLGLRYDQPLIAWLPDSMKLPVVMVFFYLCQGYFGFSRIFDLGYEPTYGIGSGRFTLDNIGAVTGVDLYSQTYVSRMDMLWSSRGHWHTAYTWFANDVSVWGVIIVMALIGFGFGIVLPRALRGDLLAVALLPLFLMMMIFLPANNVVLSNPLTFMPFAVLSFCYVLVLYMRHNARYRAIVLEAGHSIGRRLSRHGSNRAALMGRQGSPDGRPPKRVESVEPTAEPAPLKGPQSLGYQADPSRIGDE